jgi:triacylglycerol lipase
MHSGAGIMRRAIGSGYDRDMAAALVRAAAAAYGDEGEMSAWARAQGCDGCEVFRDERTDTLGFAAATDERVFVVFRGTRDLRNWMTDLDCRRVNVAPQLCVGMEIANCKLSIANFQSPLEVHEGFWAALGAVWDDLVAILDKIAPGRMEIFFAGHSLGGALAMLACARWESLKAEGKRLNSKSLESDFSLQPSSFSLSSWCYTFGQPRVGNAAFAAWYDGGRAVPALKDSGGTPLPHLPPSGLGLRARSFRVVHAEDIVPRVPWLLNCYRHAGTEAFYDALGVLHLDAPWWEKGLSDVFGTWREWTAAGRVALLDDHKVGTYLEMLKAEG